MIRYLRNSTVWLLALLATGASVADSFHTIPMNQKRLATYYIQASMLIRSLPKELRRNFVPAPDVADRVLAGWQPADSRLLPALSARLRELTGVMADGSQHQLPVYRIKRLVLGTGCVLDNIEAAVFPEKTRMLLGLSALKKAAPFTFSTNPPSLALSNCGTVTG